MQHNDAYLFRTPRVPVVRIGLESSDLITRVKQWLIISVALVIFLIGLASVWTPVPIGAVLMIFATSLLISNSSTGRSLVRRVRTRFEWINSKMTWFEDRAGDRIGRVLKTTRPLVTRLSEEESAG